jgi:hypothetical protein
VFVDFQCLAQAISLSRFVLFFFFTFLTSSNRSVHCNIFQTEKLISNSKTGGNVREKKNDEKDAKKFSLLTKVERAL